MTFSGSSVEGSIPGLSGSVSELDLTLTAANGDRLVLRGDNQWSTTPPPALTWEVVSGTGRFSQLSGSGTYEIRRVFASDGQTASVTLTLDGELGH